MFRIQPRRCHRRLEVKAQPLLNTDTLQLRRTVGKIEEEDQIEHDRRSENGISAEEIHLDLHRIVEPPEDVDVIPTFLVIAAWRVVVDPNLVEDVAVQLRIKLGLQNVLEHAKL